MIGITQKPSSHEYYLVLYYDLHTVLDSFIQIEDVMCMAYSDFYKLLYSTKQYQLALTCGIT